MPGNRKIFENILLKKSFKISIQIISIASILSMLAMIGLFIWVMLAPRTIFFIKPYLERELSSINSKYKVSIDDSIIKWDSQRHSLGIYSSNVKVLSDTSDLVAQFPEISFGFNMLRFLSGHILSSDLTISKPTIYINSSDKTLYVTPVATNNVDAAIFNVLAATLNRNNDSFKLHSIRVQDAKIFISSNNTDMVWEIADGYAKLERVKGKNVIKSEFNVNFGKDNTYFQLNAATLNETSISTEINFKELPSYSFADLFPQQQLDKKIDMYFTGSAKLLLSNTGVISGANLNIASASGSIDLPEYFTEMIGIKNLSCNIRLYDNLSSAAIDNLNLDLHGPAIKIAGNIHNHAIWPEFKPSFDLETTILNLDAAELGNYWPYKFGVTAREWVTHNIQDGLVKNAHGRFKFSYEDIANIIARDHSAEKSDTPPIPYSAIDAVINIEKANVSYLPKYPDASNVNAAVKFTGHSMDAQIASAKMLDTNITNAAVKFNNLWQHHLTIDITGDFNGSAKNFVPFLKLSYMEKPDNQVLESIYNISGDASGKLDLSIPIIPHLKYDDIAIKIAANFKNTLLPAMINGKNIVASNMDFALDKYDIDVKGDSIIGDTPAYVSLHQNLANKEQKDIGLKIKGMFTSAEIQNMGLASIPFVNGKMGLDVDIKMHGSTTDISGSADLTQSTILIENLSFEKPLGKAAKSSFNLTQSDDATIDIKDFKLQGDGFTIIGSAKANKELNGLAELYLNTAQFGQNDFTAKYLVSESSNVMDVKGKSLDISKAKLSEWFKSGPSKIKQTLNVNIKLDNLYMKNGEVIKTFVTNLNCPPKICLSGNLSGKIRDNNVVNMNIKNSGVQALLQVQSDNAGALLNALNISKDIVGGQLKIDANLGKNNAVNTAGGLIRILDFKAVKTPILGRILTLASFRGFEDLLNNEGISFKKFEAPFTMKSGVITVENAKSSGASIGITCEGSIDTIKDELDLKGVIVPAYAVNNVLGKIPLVGRIIVGKENEGILATKYSIKGSYDDAKINVNHLSILTPGFIRNIFDIFD